MLLSMLEVCHREGLTGGGFHDRSQEWQIVKVTPRFVFLSMLNTKHSDRVVIMFFYLALYLIEKSSSKIVWIFIDFRMRLPTGALKLKSGILSTYFIGVLNL